MKKLSISQGRSESRSGNRRARRAFIDAFSGHGRPAMDWSGVDALEERMMMVGTPAITEFMAEHNTGLQDEDLHFSDWLEIFNPGATALNLGGYRLTDDPANLTKWTFPGVSVPAGGRLVVFASGKNRTTLGSNLHTNFTLETSGEYLALIAPDGVSVLSSYAPEYPAQTLNVSYGLLGTVAGETLINTTAGPFDIATPGAANPVNAAIAGAAGLSLTSVASNVSHGTTSGVLDISLPEVMVAVAITGGLSLSVELHLPGPGATLELYDQSQTRLAIARPGAPGTDNHYLQGFVAPQDGTYYLRVAGQGAYDLHVVQNALIEQESNDTPNSAQNIELIGQVLGFSQSTELDHYSFNAVSGDPVTVRTFTGPDANPATGGFAAAAEVILPFNSTWKYLNPQDGLDPDLADLDFDITWQTAGYSDAAWNSGAGLLGYGGITDANGTVPTATDIGQPISGNRYTAYFRKTFNVSGSYDALVLKIKRDDAAIVYLNGVEVGRTAEPGSPLFLAAADDYALLSEVAAGGSAEGAINTLLIPGNLLIPGDNLIAVSVHQNANNSSDLGFDLSLESVQSWQHVVGTSFSEPATGSRTSVGSLTEMPFSQTGSAAGNTGVTAGDEYEIHQANMILRLGPIDLTNHGAVRVSLDARSFEDSPSSDFEAADFFRARLRATVDGVNYDETLLFDFVGGAPDTLKQLGEVLQRFGAVIGAQYTSAELLIEGAVDSATEHLYIDNVRFSEAEPDPALAVLRGDNSPWLSDGSSAGDGVNALVSGPIPTSGLYKAAVSEQGAQGGLYVLQVTGSSAAAPSAAVSGTSPASGATLGAAPLTMTVNFTLPVMLQTLHASDLKIDGIGATAVTVVDDDTAIFTLPGGLGSGAHTVSIAAGAIKDLSNRPLDAYNGSFTLNLASPRVIATSAPQGAKVTWTPVSVLAVSFDSPIAVSGLDASDLTLIGAASGARPLLGMNYISGSNTLELNFGHLADDVYVLTLLSGDGMFENTQGMDLDGSPSFPLPSGDGLPGGNFTLSFTVEDDLQTPFPLELLPVEPARNMVYQRSVTGSIDTATTSDTFTWIRQAGLADTLIVEGQGALRPMIEVIGPGMTVIASATAPAAGGAAVIEHLPAPTSGQYLLRISDAGSGTGTYTLTRIAFAGTELEQYPLQPSNDTLGAAQNIDAGFMSMSDQAERAAIVGRLPVTPGIDWFSLTLAEGQILSLAADSTGQIETLEIYNGSQVVLAGAAGPSPNHQRAIASFTPPAAGLYYVKVTGTGQYTLAAGRGLSLELEPNDQPGAAQSLNMTRVGLGRVAAGLYGFLSAESEPNDDGVVGAQATDLAAANSLDGSFIAQSAGVYRAVVTGQISSGGDADLDFYRFYARPGDSLNATAVGSTLNDPNMRLYDRNFQLLASDDDSAGSLDPRIIAASAFTYEGHYYLMVDGAGAETGAYTLTVNLTTAGQIGGAGADDYYSFFAVAGQEYRITTATPTDSTLFQQAGSNTQALFDFGSSWNWLHPLNGVDPATTDSDFHSTWFTSGYDDSAWASNNGNFGYGGLGAANSPATTNIGTPPSGQRYTAYFRKQIAIAADQTAFQLQIQRDDAAIIYLNGVEIARTSGPGSTVFVNPATPDTYTLLSDGAASSPEGELQVFTIPIPPGVQIAGTNLIAVSIHQTAANSSDLGFDLRLDVSTPVLQDVAVAVFDGLGLPVDSNDNGAADGRNVDFTFIAPSTGTYSVRVRSVAGAGDYLLVIDGAPSMIVTGVNPPDGALLGAAPAQIIVDFNLPLLGDSIDASDLKVDGQPATAVMVVDGDTLSFTPPAGLGAGSHAITIADGDLESIDGQPVSPFTSTFTVIGTASITTASATNITSFSARIGATVLSTGGQNPDLTIYWGDEDGGTNPGGWDASFSLGTQGLGTFRQIITGLDSGTQYFFRALATNSAGQAWAPTSASFTTQQAGLPVINEFLADNASILQDEDGDFSDWIEIHNTDANPFDLSGWHLTDSIGDLTRWTVPAGVVIPANGYLVIFASGKTRGVAGQELHTNFSLRRQGEYLALVRPDGLTVQHEFNPEFPSQNTDVSYGLIPGSMTATELVFPTPGSENLVGALNEQVIISEIMYHPDSETTSDEWIELYNRAPLPISLEGWFFESGVSFTFGDVVIPALGYVVVAADPVAFAAKYPAVTATVVGPWTGQLSNSGEAIDLQDNTGERIDKVEYADQGDWATRKRGELDFLHRGWTWITDHDGGGASVELVNPRLSNNHGQNWAPSLVPQGTPGAANSRASADIAPMILDLGQSPIIPTSADPVTITVRLLDEDESGSSASLHWRLDGQTTFNELVMFDDGLHGDGAENDGVFGATIGAQNAGVVVEFYITAGDVLGHSRTWPAPALDENNVPVQATNLLYQVDDSVYSGNQPIYRIIMTEIERLELQQLGASGFESNSNAQMNATFIGDDGRGIEALHNAGMRIRGAGARGASIKSYRVNLPADRPWKGWTALNLNSQFGYSQVAGSALARLAGLVTAEANPVQVRVNGANPTAAFPGQNAANYGSYVHVEPIDGDYADNHYPGDGGGNLYRNGRPNTDLSWQGTDPATYQNLGYSKATNSTENDWTDFLQLLNVLNNEPDISYLSALEQVVDIDQWLRYFAVSSLLANGETNLGNGVGDDYSLYRGVLDPRFSLILHDLDTVLGEGDGSARPPTDSIFLATALPVINRFLTHPLIVGRYYSLLTELVGTAFSPDVMDPMLDQLLGGYVPQNVIDRMKAFMVLRNANVLSQIERDMTVDHSMPTQGGLPYSTDGMASLNGTVDVVNARTLLVNGVPTPFNPITGVWPTGSGGTATLLPTGATWKYLDDGSDQGTAWRAEIFNDAAWAQGSAEFGYGDGDETTVVGFIDTDPGTAGIQKNATTYFRATFEVASAVAYSGLRVRLKYDDGAAVYLNGQEIVRTNLAAAAAFNQFAQGNAPDESAFFDFDIPASALHDGTNTLAVEVHQNTATSSDMSFDLELLGLTPGVSNVSLLPGINNILVQALDAQGVEIDRRRIEVLSDTGATTGITGTIAANRILTAAGGPYLMTGATTVAPGVTLTIEPGATLFFAPSASLTINGRLLAEGTDLRRIQFHSQPGVAGKWSGVRFQSTIQDNRMAYLDMEGGDNGNEWILANSSVATIDNLTWRASDKTIIEANSSSMIISDSHFPPVDGAEIIHGNNIMAGGHFIVRGNEFQPNTGYNDNIDFTGGQRPGPILQVLNNRFLGGGDDALDLDGTDAHIEGNFFTNYHKNNSSSSSSNAIATGTSGGNSSEIVVVRNYFLNNDHAVLLKDGALLIGENNTIVGSAIAAINFDEPNRPVDPGLGAILDNNIFFNNAATFENVYVNDPIEGTTALFVNRSIIPEAHLGLGVGNRDVDPRLANIAGGDLRLAPGSPAIGMGSNGINAGADAPAGATIAGEPRPLTRRTTATLTVDGAGLDNYRYRVNGGPWSAITSMSTPITLTGLVDGDYTVEVIGQSSAAVWQPLSEATVSRTWTVDSQAPTIHISEILASNTLLNVMGDTPDMIELYNDGLVAVDLGGMSITDDPALPLLHTFPIGTMILPGQYLTLTADGDGQTPGHVPFQLSRSGETLQLFDSIDNGGGLIDSVEFGIQIDDYSIARGPDMQWGLAQPTLGGPNVIVQTGDRSRLSINEWLASGQSLLSNDFIELHNPDGVPIDLGGLILTDDPVAARHTFDLFGLAGPGLHSIKPLSFVAPNGFALLTPDGDIDQGADHLSFKLSADGEMIGLFEQDFTPIDSIVFNSQLPDRSEGRTPDGAAKYATFALPTPGAPNAAFTGSIVQIINIDDTWSYDQSGALPAANWMSPAFSVASWPVGNALFYVEEDPLPAGKNTPLSLTNGGPQIITYYFRKDFTLDFDPAGSTITFNTVLDDGAVIYINGLEVLRAHMPAGPVGYSTLASDSISNAAFETFASIPAMALHEGLNTIAVEVHQVTASSSDVVFGLDMDIHRPAQPSNTELLLSNLRITEIMFDADPGDSYEYIELKNIGLQSIDLGGVRFTNGIDFTFPAVALAPGQTILVVDDQAAFESWYGTGLNIAGEYSGQLDDGGERVALTLPNPFVLEILEFTYDDAWYASESSAHHSFKILDPLAPIASWELAASWAPSAYPNGSPDRDDLPLTADAVVINELLAHSTGGVGDWIELRNTTAQPIDIGGWYLSDTSAQRQKYRIAPGTILPAGGLMTFTEQQHFGAASVDPGKLEAFELSSAGEEAHLTSIYADGHIAGYRQAAAFGASLPGVTFGRHVDDPGFIDYLAMSSPTFNAANSGPAVGPVVINEIHYHPAVGGVEFIELRNISPSAQNLFDPANLANPDSVWKFVDGIQFSFPVGATIAAGGYVVLIPDTITAQAFRIANNVPLDVPIHRWSASLSSLANDGERITLTRPGVPDGMGVVPQIVADTLRYDDAAPWVTTPDGMGPSLMKINSAAHGGDPANWAASAIQPQTPGYDNAAGDDIAPLILSNSDGGADPRVLSFTFSEQVVIDATDLSLFNSTLAQTMNPDSFAYDPATRIASWTFSALPDGGYTGTIQAAGVTDPAGNPLNANGNGVIAFTLSSGLRGDFNLDLSVNSLDIDLLMAARNAGTHNAFFDLTADSLVNQLDVDELVLVILNAFYGDADLNRSVSIGDLTILAEHFGQTGGGTWADGDFNGDGNISIGDLTLLAENFGQSNPLLGDSLLGDFDGDAASPAPFDLQAIANSQPPAQSPPAAYQSPDHIRSIFDEIEKDGDKPASDSDDLLALLAGE